MTYQALAILHEDGHLEMRWNGPAEGRATADTLGGLGEVLRDLAPYLADQGEATALVLNLGRDGVFSSAVCTAIVADRQGAITFRSMPSEAWAQAIQPRQSGPSPRSATAVSGGPYASASPVGPQPPSDASGPSALSEPGAGSGPETSPAPGPPRRSFLDDLAPEEPARQGWRGLLTRCGIRMSPGAAERAERIGIQTVSQHWAGPKTFAFVNGKGGASKTPLTILFAAIFARFGGAGVAAWDNNQTRGTLGWRTEKGPHDATVLDLLPHVERLLGTGAQSADLAHFVHHQSADRYDVLRSQPLELAAAQRLSAADVDAIHQVMSKYYRLILMDSGNDESDPMWQRMIDHTDQLVVATTTLNDRAEAGALLLEALAHRDPASAKLARNAVVVVSQADPAAKPADIKRIVDGFTQLVREVVVIPFDPALISGRLTLGALRPTTQRAALRAAAAAARGLSTPPTGVSD